MPSNARRVIVSPMRCPCGSRKNLDQCCDPYISGSASPLTAEALMRSRYVAYTRGDIDYIERTTARESRADFDAQAARAWSTEATWLGLQILATGKGQAEDLDGTVEFVATYRRNGEILAHHEVSRFRNAGRAKWSYVGGDRGPFKAGETQKPGRNASCACGSGKKFKKCCGSPVAGPRTYCKVGP